MHPCTKHKLQISPSLIFIPVLNQAAGLRFQRKALSDFYLRTKKGCFPIPSKRSSLVNAFTEAKFEGLLQHSLQHLYYLYSSISKGNFQRKFFPKEKRRIRWPTLARHLQEGYSITEVVSIAFYSVWCTLLSAGKELSSCKKTNFSSAQSCTQAKWSPSL